MMTLLFTLPSLLIHDSTEGKKGEQVSPCLFHLSVQFSRSVMSDCLQHHGSSTRLPCPSPTLRLTQTHIHWVGDAIQLILCHPFLLLLSIIPRIRVFSNEAVLRTRWPKYWSFSFSISPSKEHSGLISFRKWTGWISLQSKGLSRVFSNTTVQKHRFFSSQLSLWSNSHIHTWPLEKP